MRDSEIITDYLYSVLRKYLNLEADGRMAVPESILQEMRASWPGASDEDLYGIIALCRKAYMDGDQEKSELVITGPDSFRLNTRKINTAIEEMLRGAETTITMTGYSVSEYFADALDQLITKSLHGVYITLYFNDISGQKETLQKLLDYRGKYLKIFEYQKQGADKMAALHAKMVTTDRENLLISSANLSYHGMAGNIEMGILMKSKEKVEQIEDVMKQLRYQKVFLPYEDRK